jgi:hypothetical protein
MATNKDDMLPENIQGNDAEKMVILSMLILRQKKSQKGMITRQMTWLQVIWLMMTPRQLKK